MTGLKESAMASFWNAGAAKEVLSAVSNTAAYALYNFPKNTVTSNDENLVVSNLSDNSAYDITL